MSAATINGAPVLQADLVLPYEGAWTADVHADLEEVPAQATLVLLGRTYRGTVRTGGVVGGTARLRVVGGAGGLEQELQPRHYRDGVTVRILLEDILQEAGEALSAEADAAVLAEALPRWTRVAAPARDQLAHLVRHIGAQWRVLADGTVWVGRYSWLEAPAADYVQIDAAPQDHRAILSAEIAPWEPGQALGTFRIGSVRHLVSVEASRSILVGPEPPGARGVVGAELARAGWPFAAALPGRAVAQDADGTLQVQPDDPRWPPLVGVPIRLGLPGSSCRVAAGARVLLEWEGGSPTAPAVTAWGDSTAQELRLGGTRRVAREGDAVGWLVTVVAVVGPGQAVVSVNWVAVDPGLPPPPVPLVPGTYAQPIRITAGSDLLRTG